VEIDTLLSACAAIDGAAYLEREKSLNAHPDMPTWFFAREGTRLLGALSIFAPKMDEAEIGAAVLPEARRRGVFSAMLAAARRELLRFGYLDELFVVDGGSSAGKSVAASLGAHCEFTEYAMRYSGSPLGRGMPGLELRRIGVERIEELVGLREAEFGDSREEAENFERATFAAPGRKSYGAFVDGRMVGACSLGFEDTTVSINGLVVDKSVRGKGYGQAILGELIMMLSGRGLELILDVNSRNANALHIYEKAGFVPAMTKEYWRRR
jgi:GNAT superfamily N-acetyltransferase